MKEISHPVSQFKETIFTTMTVLANQYKAVNLSQGFPDFDGPQWIQEKAIQAMREEKNQYAPGCGILPLREELAKIYNYKYSLTFDPQTEITICNGATEGLFITSLALFNPDDEVIVFEPFYDSYLACIQIPRARPIPVTLHAPDFKFKTEELEKSIGPNTKAIFLNSPHNPTGKVFSKGELQFFSDLALKHDLYIITDEVYEHLLFDGVEHLPIASFPNMKERTITISSAGKTFGLTGWKVGWVLAPEKISQAIRKVHQFCTFSVAHPLQWGILEGLKSLKTYIPEFQNLYQNKRDFFISGLQGMGLNPFRPQGTYFVMCPIPEMAQMIDVDFCKDLIIKGKLASIPPSSFYLKSKEGESFVRFCFAKEEETLKLSLKNLQNYLKEL